MPGVTDTRFFERAGMLETPVGQGPKGDAAAVAKDGVDAMMAGEASVVSGWKNRVQSALAGVIPAPVLASQHRKLTEPSGEGTPERPR
jgi:short-subunit dehydrogenase